MNAVAQTFAIALASVASAAAIGVGLANHDAEQAMRVVALERVVVNGQRTQVAMLEKLPRVVIEQRRAVPAEVTVAQAHATKSL